MMTPTTTMSPGKLHHVDVVGAMDENVQRVCEEAIAKGWQKTEDIAPPYVCLITLTCGPTEILLPNTPTIIFLLQILGDDFFLSVAEATNHNVVLRYPLAQPGLTDTFARSVADLPRKQNLGSLSKLVLGA